MADYLDALERLARMRAEGTLSEAEFEAEKAKLLAGKRAGGRAMTLAEGWEQSRETRRRVRSYTKWLWIALLVGFPLFVGITLWRLKQMTPDEAAQIVADSIPQCASQPVKDALRGAIENSPASRLIAIQLLEVAHIDDRGIGGKPMARYCAADITTNGGAEHIGYTVRLSNENMDEFLVEVGDDTGPPPTDDASQNASTIPTNKTHTLVVTDAMRAQQDNPASNLLMACVGDTLRIENQSSQNVGFDGAPDEPGDDFADLGAAKPGGFVEVKADTPGNYVITDAGGIYATLFHYRVSECP